MPAPAPSEPPAWQRQCCDLCGKGPIKKQMEFNAHRGGKYCRALARAAMAGKERREDNVKRTIARKIGRFARFVSATIKRQRAEKGRIYFIPFGGVGWKRCGDTAAQAAVVRQSIKKAGGAQQGDTPHYEMQMHHGPGYIP